MRLRLAGASQFASSVFVLFTVNLRGCLPATPHSATKASLIDQVVANVCVCASHLSTVWFHLASLECSLMREEGVVGLLLMCLHMCKLSSASHFHTLESKLIP